MRVRDASHQDDNAGPGAVGCGRYAHVKPQHLAIQPFVLRGREASHAHNAPPPPLYVRPKLPGEDDIIDEVLFFFKANVLFKHFEVKGPADRVLIYLTLYITQCLQKLEKCPSKIDGVKGLTAMAHETFRIPGDPGFALGSFFPAPASSQEGEMCRSYLKQVREELGRRLVDKVYGEDGQPSKFWLVFAKRKVCALIATCTTPLAMPNSRLSNCSSPVCGYTSCVCSVHEQGPLRFANGCDKHAHSFLVSGRCRHLHIRTG